MIKYEIILNKILKEIINSKKETAMMKLFLKDQATVKNTVFRMKT